MPLLFLLALNFLNVFDTAATLVALDRGAIEMNPVARALLYAGPGWFVFVKVAGVGLASGWLAERWAAKGVQFGAGLAVGAYAVVAMLHLVQAGVL